MFNFFFIKIMLAFVFLNCLHNFMYLFIDCPGASLLCVLFSSCGKHGLSLVAVCGVLIAVASLVA